MRGTFGWSYPPGCSGPPEDDCTCAICGGDAEAAPNEGGCLCGLLIGTPEGDESDVRSLGDKVLNHLQARFATAAGNLRMEQMRRYNLNMVICKRCGDPLTFAEAEQQEGMPYHPRCEVAEQEEAERL